MPNKSGVGTGELCTVNYIPQYFRTVLSHRHGIRCETSQSIRTKKKCLWQECKEQNDYTATMGVVELWELLNSCVSGRYIGVTKTGASVSFLNSHCFGMYHVHCLLHVTIFQKSHIGF